MTPSYDGRFKNIIKALEQVILPGIAPQNSLAQEQAALAMAQLRLMERQAPYLDQYAMLCLREMEQLAETLAAEAHGGARTEAAAKALRAAIAGDAATSAGAAKVRRNMLAAAIDSLVIASHKDGDADFRRESQAIIVDHGLRQSWRDRSWFAAAGLDPDAEQLLPIATLLDA